MNDITLKLTHWELGKLCDVIIDYQNRKLESYEPSAAFEVQELARKLGDEYQKYEKAKKSIKKRSK